MVRLHQLPRAYGYRRGFNLSYQRRNVVLTLMNNSFDTIDIPYAQLTEMMYEHDMYDTIHDMYDTIYQTRKTIRKSLRIHESMLQRAREGVIVFGIGEEFYSESDLDSIAYGIQKHKVFLQHPVFFMD